MVNHGRSGKIILTAVIFGVFTLAFGSSAKPGAAGEINTGYFGNVAIKGYDPVAYFTQSRAVEGSEELSYDWLGATWYFASLEHRDLFAATPVSYSPQYGGLCADGVAYGQTTANIDPEAWRIIDGKLYLSYDQGAAVEIEEIPGQIARADKNWPEIREKFLAQ